MRHELYASAGLHVALLLWLAFGDALTRPSEPQAFEATGVTLISSAEFDALSDPVVAPVEEAPPEPEPEPLPEPEPAAPEPDPEPEPTPEPEPEPEPTPEPPAEEVIAALPQPTLGDPTAPISETPAPQEAPRVAPTPAPAPPPEAEIAPEVVEQPEPAEPGPEVEPAEPETAPEEAATELATEADEPSAAPVASLRPATRPSRPEPEPAVDPIEAALAEALASPPEAEPAAATPPASRGPALGRETIAGFERQVGACWNVGALGTAQLDLTIEVYFELERDGRPVIGTIDLIGYTGDVTAATQAFDAARRAIIRCGTTENDGYDLPEESYDQWREVIAVFDPAGMRLR